MKPLLTLLFSVLTTAVFADQYVAAPIQYAEVPMSTMPMNEAVTVYSAEVTPPPYSLSEGVMTTVSDPVGTDITGMQISQSALMPLPNIAQTNTTTPNTTTPNTTTPNTTTPKTFLPTSTAKPTDRPITVPLPLGPRLPHQDNPPDLNEAVATVRGQVETVDSLKGILDAPLPPAQGSIETGTIDSKLTESLAATDSSEDFSLIEPGQTDSVVPDSAKESSTAVSDPLGYTVLLAAMVITTIGLIYMAFVAYDYRQRWVQSLTTQNDRYLGSGMYDMEVEDVYSMRSWTT